MSTNKYLFIIMALLMVLVGCRGGADEIVTITEPPTSDALRVAMLLPESKDDESWSQAGYEGLLLIEKELKAEIAYTDQVSVEGSEEILRDYAEQEYDFIVAHGGQYIPSVDIVADEFPRTHFAIVGTYEGNNRNFGALSYRESEMGYLTGVVAALKSKSHKIAYIGGEAYKHVQERANSFEKGAKTITPEIEISVKWVDSWTDADKTRAIAKEVIEEGSDVLLVNVNYASLAAFEEAEKAGIYAMGWSVDHHEAAPDTILTTALQQVQVLLLEGAKLVQLDRWEGKQYRFGLRAGAHDLAPFYGLLTPEEEETVNTVRYEILTDKIDIIP